MMYCALESWLSGEGEAALEGIARSRAAVGAATVFLGSSEGPEVLFRAYDGDADRVLPAGRQTPELLAALVGRGLDALPQAFEGAARLLEPSQPAWRRLEVAAHAPGLLDGVVVES